MPPIDYKKQRILKSYIKCGILVVVGYSVASNSNAFSTECTHFAKIMQSGVVNLEFLRKNLSKIFRLGRGVNKIIHR